MEEWIGTLVVIGMIPGLIVLIGIVAFAVIQMARDPDAPPTTTELTKAPATRDADA